MDKDNYEIVDGDLVLRRASKDDDMKTIAGLIYDTDPYIYPFWFQNNKDEAIDYLSENIVKDGFVFNYNNIYVAYSLSRQKIMGILVGIDHTTNFNFDYDASRAINYNYDFTIRNYILPCIEEAKEISGIYIMNVCVLAESRGMKIGSKLLGNFISKLEESGFDDYQLDCLLHNLRAKNLYHSFGFKEMREIVGFDGTDNSTIEVVTFKRHKGDYLPSEFQQDSDVQSILSRVLFQ